MQIIGIVLALAVAAPAAADDAREPYLVLAGFGPDDPYYAAARRLAEHHDGAHLMSFDVEAPCAIIDDLRRIEPRHVAFVLRPDQIHVNSVRAILKMATRVDADPFVDFEYGYITGATPEEADRFVKNIAEAARMSMPLVVGQSAVWGDRGDSTLSREPYLVGQCAYACRSLCFRAPDGAHGRDQAFIDANLDALEGCGAIIMGGHGMPWEIVSGPHASDIDRLDLFPAVAFNYACYTGVTSTYAELEFGKDQVRDRIRTIGSDRSFALAAIRRGVVGYVAYVTPRPAGPEMTVDFQKVLTGATMGAARRADYAKIALGYLGFGEAGIDPPEVVDGHGMPRAELDPVRHMMLDSATGGILFGDPSFRPFPPVEQVLPLRAASRVDGERLEVTLRLRGREASLWGADPYRRFDDATQQMAMKVYDRVAVPPGFGSIGDVRVDEATSGGTPIETLPVIWAEEQDQGNAYLHVKVNFARSAAHGDLEILVVATAADP